MTRKQMAAQSRFWSYKTEGSPVTPPPGYSNDGWNSLTPGMQREIWRDYERRNARAK